MKKMSPIVFVETVEPCLPFWTDWLGFEITATVPLGDRIGFAMLQKGPVEVMYQAMESLREDMPSLVPDVSSGSTTLFLEVDSLDPYIDTMDAPILVPRRQTFYGMDEIFVRAPCGSIVGLAARVES